MCNFTVLHVLLTIAPNDYEALMTTLTFREGADGSLPSDAECVGVFIFDDALPEDTESLSFRILSPNTSAVRIMEGHEWKRILILDDDSMLFLGHMHGLRTCVCILMYKSSDQQVHVKKQ